MYKLFGSPKSRAFRVMWMFEELGVDYELIKVGPRSEEILALNPGGKVPVLVAGDDVIIDSSAIVQYLADAHDQFTYPAGTIERAKQDSFLHFANDDMDAICWVDFKHKFVLPEALRVPEVNKACKFDWDKSMMTLALRLGDNEYVMGDKFTVPDIIICHVAGWAKMCGFEWPDNKASDYFKRVRSRPAFKKAIELREAS